MRPCLVLAAFGALLPGPLRAQEAPQAKIPAVPQVARILRPDFARFDEATPQPGSKAQDRFMDVLRRVPIGDTAARSMTLTATKSPRGPAMLVRGTKEQIETVEAALAELGRSTTSQARLQISLAMVPLDVARTHRLEPGKTVVADAAAWAELLRDTVKAKGSVHNPPEVISGWLQPFERAAALPGDAASERRLRVRGEVVPLAPTVVAAAVEVDLVVTPAGKPRLPSTTTVAAPVFRLAAGEAAMMMAINGGTPVVLIVRCLEVGDQVNEVK